MRSQLHRLSSLDLEIKPHQGRAKSAGKTYKRTRSQAMRWLVERRIWIRVGSGNADRGRGEERHCGRLNRHRECACAESVLLQMQNGLLSRMNEHLDSVNRMNKESLKTLRAEKDHKQLRYASICSQPRGRDSSILFKGSHIFASADHKRQIGDGTARAMTILAVLWQTRSARAAKAPGANDSRGQGC